MHLSSSWSGCSQDTVQSDLARLVLARDTTAQGYWCVRVWGCARHMQLLWLLHHEKLQVPDRLHRWTKGCCRSGHDMGASNKRVKRASYLYRLLFLLYCFATIFACYYITNLDFWVLRWAYFQIGWAYFRMGWAYFRMGWAYFRERGFSDICPPLSLSNHLSSLPMGVLLRDCGMCIPTYHVHKNYVTYTVAMWPFFSSLRQFRWLICVAMSSLAVTSSRWIPRSRGNTNVKWMKAEMLEVSSYSWCLQGH